MGPENYKELSSRKNEKENKREEEKEIKKKMRRMLGGHYIKNN